MRENKLYDTVEIWREVWFVKRLKVIYKFEELRSINMSGAERRELD